MASPEDEIAAGASPRNELRTSGADREQALEVLKVAFVQERLTKDEFDQRIDQVLTSRTYADLDALTADIPAGPVSPHPAQRRETGRREIRRASAAIAAVTFVTAEALLLPRVHHPVAGVAAGVAVSMFSAVLMAGLLTLIAWVLDRSASRQSSYGTPPPGNGPRQLGTADPGGQSPDSSTRPRPAAQAVRRLRPVITTVI
jgi:hypothetical protein